MKTPTVSIILPVYNGASRIQEAIHSVISQSYTDWELLVIDDGSTDNTGEIVDRFVKNDLRVRYIKNEANFGIQKTLNRGLKEARGEYIARIDDDDIWVDKDKLKKQLDFLERNMEYVLVGTGAVLIDDNKKELARFIMPEEDTDIRNKILSKNCFIHSSVMFKKSATFKFNGYDESKNTQHIEDYDLWLKLGTKGKLANLPIYTAEFTLREGSISAKNKVDQFKKILPLIKKYKKLYPNYFSAVVRSVLRVFIYVLIFKLPIKNSIGKIIKIYKENW